MIRDRLLLRICRWISAVRQVRDPENGRFLGHVYAMHGEPVQWHAAIEYDERYVAVLERAQGHHDRRVQRRSSANVLGIRDSISRRGRPFGARRPGRGAHRHRPGDRVRLGYRLGSTPG